MKTMLMSREFTLMTCLCSENSFSNIEDLYFKSLGISGQASNAPGQFHWCFPTIFSESWLSASRIFFLVTIWLNTNIATSLYAQARHLHVFQSQGNFWKRLTLETNVLYSLKKLMRNFGKIRWEFRTAGYLVFLKPYPDAGWHSVLKWTFQRGVLFHLEPVRKCASARSEDFRKSPQIDTYNLYFQAIKMYGQFLNQYIYLTISFTYAIFYS